MSGGSFNYIQFNMREVAEELDVIATNSAYAQRVNDKIQLVSNALQFASKLLQEADWLISGDNGEDTFLENIALIESEYNKLLDG